MGVCFGVFFLGWGWGVDSVSMAASFDTDFYRTGDRIDAYGWKYLTKRSPFLSPTALLRFPTSNHHSSTPPLAHPRDFLRHSFSKGIHAHTTDPYVVHFPALILFLPTIVSTLLPIHCPSCTHKVLLCKSTKKKYHCGFFSSFDFFICLFIPPIHSKT